VPALLLSTALLAAYASINALFLFDSRNLVLPAAGTVTAVALCWSGLTLARFIIESRERRRITQRFSNYVDPALVDYVIENPEQVQLDGKVREMTVVFTDLAGFTTISEKLREKTVPILNEYMSLMVPIIREHSGYWDKFLGDGIMFFYNGLAPIADHAIRAIDTAMEMQIVTQRFNARLRERQLPNVAMRAGISTGEMVVGDAGSKDAVHRANNFTVLGDAVNLGARLEGANKPIGTKILINGRTAELSEGKFLLRPIGNVRVVGKLEGVQLFEPLCRLETATDDQKRIVEFATTIVESFADADFDKCVCTARKMEEELGSTKFSQFYMRLAREHIDHPTNDFEGQIVLSEK
jgi:adenylate cyclase